MLLPGLSRFTHLSLMRIRWETSNRYINHTFISAWKDPKSWSRGRYGAIQFKTFRPRTDYLAFHWIIPMKKFKPETEKTNEKQCFFIKTKYAEWHISRCRCPLWRPQKNKPILFIKTADASMELIAMTLGKKFELEHWSRKISTITYIKQIQEIGKDLLLAGRKQIGRSNAANSSHLKWSFITMSWRACELWISACLSNSKLKRSRGPSTTPTISTRWKHWQGSSLIYTYVKELLRPGWSPINKNHTLVSFLQQRSKRRRASSTFCVFERAVLSRYGRVIDQNFMAEASATTNHASIIKLGVTIISQ